MWRHRGYLGKGRLFIAITVFLIVSANVSSAQLLPIPSGLGLDFGILKITPFAQAGYKSFSISLNLPLTSDEGFLFAPPALDLKFRDARVGVGTVGLDARLPAGLFVTLKAEGSTTKNIDVVTDQSAVFGGQPLPYTWTGSKFRWWDADALIGFNCSKYWSAVVGLRYDKLTVGMNSPIDASGNPLGTPFFPAETFILGGDVLVTTWIPYFGLQLNGPYYRASFLYSPWASPDVIVPQQFFDLIPIPGGFFNTATGMEWKFSKTGQFFEAGAEYDFPLFDRLKLGFWVKGSWMGFKGNGTWHFRPRIAYVARIHNF